MNLFRIRTARPILAVLLLLFCLTACESRGTNTTPIQTPVAGEVGRDQRALQGTESGSAIISEDPTILNFLGFKSVAVKVDKNATEVTAEGHQDGTLVLESANFGNWNKHGSNSDAKVSSGGATGGAGDGGTVSRAGAGGTGQ